MANEYLTKYQDFYLSSGQTPTSLRKAIKGSDWRSMTLLDLYQVVKNGVDHIGERTARHVLLKNTGLRTEHTKNKSTPVQKEDAYQMMRRVLALFKDQKYSKRFYIEAADLLYKRQSSTSFGQSKGLPSSALEDAFRRCRPNLKRQSNKFSVISV